jgi:hypothetical protein
MMEIGKELVGAAGEETVLEDAAAELMAEAGFDFSHARRR